MKKKILIFLAVLLVALGIYVWQTQPAHLAAEEITPDQLRQMINTQDGFFVYFHSPTCPNCIKAEPLIAKAVKLSKIKIVQLNVKDYPEAKTEFQVPGTPSIYYYHDHKLAKGITGALAGYKDYVDFFQNAINS